VTASGTSGCVSDVPCTPGFHSKRSPAFLSYVCLLGWVEDPAESQRLRYCELGCGRRYCIMLRVATNSDIDFTGIDVNPSRIA